MERKTVCKNCNKEFIKIHPNTPFCSEECKCEYYSKRNNSPLNCLNCNKKLEASRVLAGGKFCNSKCVTEYSRRPEITKERAERIQKTRANWSEEEKKSVYEKATKTRKEHKGMTDEEYRESFRRRAEKAKMTRANWSEERVVEEKRKRKERLENMTE